MTVDDAVRKRGNRKIRRTAMNSAVRDLVARPKLRGYPPRVFISYRWEDEAGKDWVQHLAAYLRSRGYRVDVDLEQGAVDRWACWSPEMDEAWCGRISRP